MAQEEIIATKDVEAANTDIHDLMQVLKFRHATKKFDSTRKITKEQFDYILEAARLAPTSFGLEPWKMIVLTDKEIRAKLKPVAWGAQDALDNASHFVVLLANKKSQLLFGTPYVEHMLKEIHKIPQEAYELYKGAYPRFADEYFKISESERAAFDWAGKQAYIVLANMLITAAYQGIDTCAIEGFIPKEFDRILGEEEKLFDTNEYGVAVCAAFGFRNEKPHRDKSRRPLFESVIYK